MIFRGYGKTAHLYDFLLGRPKTSKMLKKPASSDLVSFRPSTYQMRFSEVGSTGGAFPFAKDPFEGRTAHTKCGLYLLDASLAAALLRECSPLVQDVSAIEVLLCRNGFPAAR
jgi:hypothetical protein